MVLNKINPNETLRTSYPKINAAIDAADRADNNASEAKSLANQALANSESTQEQLDQIVIEGDSSVEAAQARVDADGNPHTTLKERLDFEHNQLSSQLAQKVNQTNARFRSDISSEEVQLGEELVDGTGWTSTGWTGNFSTGFTHIKGQTSPLKRTIPQGSVTNVFQVELTVTNAGQLGGGTSDFYITIGGSEPFETYKGTFDSEVYTFGIKSGMQNNELVITPHADFEGTISDISVKEIIRYSSPNIEFEDSTNENTTEIRNSKSELDNLFIGKRSGRSNTTGNQNVSIGNDSMKENTSGFWNVALGQETLRDNTVGTRNVAIGRIAMAQNISGDRNVAIGSWALTRNTTGRANIAIGADALYYNESGDFNVAIGLVALGQNTRGRNNIAIGERTMSGSEYGFDNVALGKLALYYNQGTDNFAVGMQAMYRNRAGSRNIAIGHQSLFWNEEGYDNIALGQESAYENKTGLNNIAIGKFSLQSNETGNGSVAIGIDSASKTKAGQQVAIGGIALRDNVNGEGNTAVGYGALVNAEGERNVALGRNAGVGLGTGNYNVFLGSSAGSSANNGDNNILIGYNVQKLSTQASNQLNIGNVIMSRDMTTGVIEIQKLKLTDLPTTAPSEQGMIWNDNGTLKIS